MRCVLFYTFYRLAMSPTFSRHSASGFAWSRVAGRHPKLWASWHLPHLFCKARSICWQPFPSTVSANAGVWTHLLRNVCGIALYPGVLRPPARVLRKQSLAHPSLHLPSTGTACPRTHTHKHVLYQEALKVTGHLGTGPQSASCTPRVRTLTS